VIVGALVVRPLIGETTIGLVLFSVSLLLVLLLSLLTIQVDELVGERERLLAQRRRYGIIAWALAIPAVGERLYAMSSPEFHTLRLGTITWFAFLGFVTWTLLRNLLRHREVTGETISLSISIYLLLGMTWGLLYAVILEFQPDAFHFGDAAFAIESGKETQIMPVLFYFSLTTLSTVGFGDITPVTLAARYMAVAEAILGQFYLAILVARLVGMHMSRSRIEPPAQET